MTFAELKLELSDRGFNYLSDTRSGVFINRAKDRLDNMYRWPYRDTVAAGAAPLTVADLGQVESVVNTSQGSYPLCEAQHTDLTNWFGDLTITGTPAYWYRTNLSATLKVAVYPVSTNNISVQYWKRTPALTGVTVPLSPDTYHTLIVDLAVQMAYRDSDNHASAEALWGEINRQILEMIEDLLPQQQFSYQTTGYGSEDS